MSLTRLPNVTAPSANHVPAPITVEVTLHDPDGREYALRLTCGSVPDIGPDTEHAVEYLGIDAGLSEWRAA